MPNTAAKTEHVLIIEATRLAWFFSKMVEEVVAPGSHQIVAILDSRPKMKHRSLNGYPIIGAPEDLEKVIADYAAHGVQIDTVVLAAQPDALAATAWQEVSRTCQARNITSRSAAWSGGFEPVGDKPLAPAGRQRRRSCKSNCPYP